MSDRIKIEVLEVFAAASITPEHWEGTDQLDRRDVEETIDESDIPRLLEEAQGHFTSRALESWRPTIDRKAQVRDAQKAFKARNRAAGRCSQCLVPVEPGKKMCRRHLDAFAERWRERKRGMRERLPDTRFGTTHRFKITYNEGDELRQLGGYIETGCYSDGRLGEIFIRIGKPGSTEAMYDQFAIAASVALQYGAPVDDFFKKFVGSQFSPSGATANPEIPRCTSVLDYVARWILSKYGKKEQL